MWKLRTLLLCSTVAGLAAAALPASAAPVLNGSVNVDGLSTWSPTTGAVHFVGPGSILAGGQTGDFAALLPGNYVSMHDFNFLSFASTLIYNGTDTNGLTVSFTSSSEVSPPVVTGKVLGLDYIGTVTLGGQSAAAEFVASFNDVGKFVGSFSSITATVPEPASLAILGVGLLGLCLVRPKHNRFS